MIKLLVSELEYNNSKLDEQNYKTINKKNIKIKLNKIANIIKEIKSNG